MRPKRSARPVGGSRPRKRRRSGEVTPSSDSPVAPSATPQPNPKQVEAGTSSCLGDEAVAVPGANGGCDGAEKVVTPESSQGRCLPGANGGCDGAEKVVTPESFQGRCLPGANGGCLGTEEVVTPESSQGRCPPEDLCPENRIDQELDKAPCLRCDQGGHLRICLSCDGSDNLLRCSVGGCPIVIHKECLGCEPSFDESGNFYCPYCTYKRAVAKVRESRGKFVLAEKLNDFLNTGKYKEGGKNLEGERAKASDSRVHLSRQDKINNDSDKEANRDRASQFSEPMHHLPEKTDSFEDPLAGHQSEKGKSKPVAASLPGDSSNGPKDDRSARNQTTEGMAGPSIVSPQVMPEPSRSLPSVERSSPLRISSWELVSGDNSANPSNLRVGRPRKLMEANILSGKRERLKWTPEEEDKLRELVPLFSSKANKNIPWRKILEQGRPIFHNSRMPSDLKDKWRTMTGNRR
ncbi:hypothetical protein MLD38_021566 [Melastoma candidum]|uniref:Uncharacterized protein n=1 Tax=Melastoma candidum TaxID=119954 RepID=A0ACB9QFQ8_9MYRT|nr:hypothetical protein MLD38_021566 [Melastoma candidum]